MFIYRYRIFDRYQKDIASLAILIDGRTQWRPTFYESSLWQSKVRMDYPILKLIDYRESKDELLKSRNPFALVILAQLSAIETKSDQPTRLITKIVLTKKLYQHGWKKEQILKLYRCLDAILSLPKPLELEYNNVIEAFEEKLNVAYVTTAERIGIEKGIQQGLEMGVAQGVQQGMQQGEIALLKSLLEHKFSSIPQAYLHKMDRASSAQLLEWGKKVLSAQNLDEIFTGS